MNKNTDAVPAGVAALYADITAHTPEEWKASGSELGYLEWVEQSKKAEENKDFSVLLMYPNGQTYFAWVAADSPQAAVARTKIECVKNYSGDAEDAEDLVPLLVLSGHHECLLSSEDFA